MVIPDTLATSKRDSDDNGFTGWRLNALNLMDSWVRYGALMLYLNCFVQVDDLDIRWGLFDGAVKPWKTRLCRADWEGEIFYHLVVAAARVDIVEGDMALNQMDQSKQLPDATLLVGISVVQLT
ncbi:uncharacterized protein HKW66_Vig0105980 [Vigna angularis]|uniref:Uncharacterized protein n=1 Tax=Phaseolus angularis TaxID=3914 RepID=A0A8T0KKC7_PHAAN|nr:uncharacterized protein HKW66_Vig0105980 [Vigna angularis]